MLCNFPHFSNNLGPFLLLFKKDCAEKQYSRACYEQRPLSLRKSDHTRQVAVYRRFIQWRIHRRPLQGSEKNKKRPNLGRKVPPPRLSDPVLSLSFVYRMSFRGVIKRVISPYNKSDCLFYCMYLSICKT